MAKTKNPPDPTYTVVRDTREQQGWDFPAKDPCLGTVDGCLKTGDYSLVGFETALSVERKRSTGEWAANVFQARFERELERLVAFKDAWVIWEFTVEDIVLFPSNSGIPRPRWRSLRVTPQLLLKRTLELMRAFPAVHFVPAGRDGRSVASSLFKRVVETHGQP
jgi:hypothetical protein